MIAAGAQLRTPADLGGFGAPDEQWLTLVAKQGWVVLMRDQRIRYRYLERTALVQASVASFVFTGGQATAIDTAKVVCRLLAKLVKISRSENRPFLYGFGLNGSLARVKLKT